MSKGLAEARDFYEQYGKQMIADNFADYADRIAVGLAGHGSECFGFDDELSRDHDFGIGFCMWLTDEDYDRIGFRLSRAYTKLVRAHGGGYCLNESQFVGKGVHTTTEFYTFYVGAEVPVTAKQWLALPDSYLAEATNGRVFCDTYGDFSDIRAYLLNRPEDVRLKKLASALFGMAQSGQYNLPRCLARNERVAAFGALSRFVESTMSVVYLLNNAYMPYYKWAHRGLTALPVLGAQVGDMLTALVGCPLDDAPALAESVCAVVADGLRSVGLTERTETFLEPYAYCINDQIHDVDLRTMSIAT